LLVSHRMVWHASKRASIGWLSISSFDWPYVLQSSLKSEVSFLRWRLSRTRKSLCRARSGSSRPFKLMSVMSSVSYS
jgi:hypothetical protein